MGNKKTFEYDSPFIKNRIKIKIILLSFLFICLSCLVCVVAVLAATNATTVSEISVNYITSFSYILPKGETFKSLISSNCSGCKNIIFDDINNSKYSSVVESDSKKQIGVDDKGKYTTDGVALFYDSSNYTAYVLADKTIIFNSDSSKMFSNLSSLEKISFANIDTSQVTNMSNMFYYCSGLTSLSLSNF
ncbi:MAG: BspA family leucine-rich repeat surface protein, partial [Clostridia bacterium]|nr:BspA family leucine-rich repeat surface protein [Clostridia bacterium]